MDHIEAIRQAAELRLRPVLMTALVAALGFLSHGRFNIAWERGPAPARHRSHRRYRFGDLADDAALAGNLCALWKAT
jgi:hypothetical protein